jgi:hypothetical protein
MSSPNSAKGGGGSEAAQQKLRRLFREKIVLELGELRSATGQRSRRSLFRDLCATGYVSSYTHAGRYYTLVAIPQFDEHGLWWHQGVGFSRAGTLKETVVELVGTADRGWSHSELERLLRVRVHNTLLALVRGGRIDREPMGNVYLYVSAEAARAAEQISHRQASALPLVSTEVVIAVLVEALQVSEVLAAPAVVAARLTTRGLPVTAEQVEQVYVQHRLETGKKTAEPRQPRSRR